MNLISKQITEKISILFAAMPKINLVIVSLKYTNSFGFGFLSPLVKNTQMGNKVQV